MEQLSVSVHWCINYLCICTYHWSKFSKGCLQPKTTVTGILLKTSATIAGRVLIVHVPSVSLHSSKVQTAQLSFT